jgi:hypothetical protein
VATAQQLSQEEGEEPETVPVRVAGEVHEEVQGWCCDSVQREHVQDPSGGERCESGAPRHEALDLPDWGQLPPRDLKLQARARPFRKPLQVVSVSQTCRTTFEADQKDSSLRR